MRTTSWPRRLRARASWLSRIHDPQYMPAAPAARTAIRRRSGSGDLAFMLPILGRHARGEVPVDRRPRGRRGEEGDEPHEQGAAQEHGQDDVIALAGEGDAVDLAEEDGLAGDGPDRDGWAGGGLGGEVLGVVLE